MRMRRRVMVLHAILLGIVAVVPTAWDDQGSFYAPVWTFGDGPRDLAILKATVEDPMPINPADQ